jgi:hypothetical protein
MSLPKSIMTRPVDISRSSLTDHPRFSARERMISTSVFARRRFLSISIGLGLPIETCAGVLIQNSPMLGEPCTFTAGRWWSSCRGFILDTEWFLSLGGEGKHFREGPAATN